VQHLVEALAVKGILANNVVAQNLDLGGGKRPCVTASCDPFVGVDLDKGLAHGPGVVQWAAAMRVLDAV
jgi:hypothetical protein